MSAKENIELLRRWFKEVWNEGKIETIAELMAPDAVAVGQLEDATVLRGPAEFAAFAEGIRGAFPDMNAVVEDAIGTDDKVALRWSATMTHRGDHLGMPATGKRVRITGMTIVRMVDGKIVEGWDSWDQLAMLEQIGSYHRPKAMLLNTA